MRQVRLRIADTLHDRDLPVAPQRHQRRERRMQPRVRIELQHLLTLDADASPELVVQRIRVRHHRVEFFF